MSEKRPLFRMDDAPKKVNERGLTSQEQEEWDSLIKGDEPQKLIFTNIPYSDHGGNTKTIVGAVYAATHKLLPPQLPALLPPLDSPPAYAIHDIPGKGKGVIATRNICLGEIVIIERPILLTPCVILNIDSLASFPIYAEESLTPEVWEKFNDLSNAKGVEISKFDGISFTNAFTVHLMGAKESYGAVFLELSRLNHSCGPNLGTSWNTDLFTFSVRAVREIRTGEELTVAYEGMCNPHATRRFDLKRKYKFDCTCGYCTKPSSTSDLVRVFAHAVLITSKYDQMYDDLVRPGIPHHTGQKSTKVFLNILLKSLVDITREGIESASAMWHYVYLMKAWGLFGDKKRFKEWGFKAVLTSVQYAESEGEKARREVEQWIDWVKEPEKNYHNWGRFR